MYQTCLYVLLEGDRLCPGGTRCSRHKWSGGTSFSVTDGPGGPFIPETDCPGGPSVACLTVLAEVKLTVKYMLQNQIFLEFKFLNF